MHMKSCLIHKIISLQTIAKSPLEWLRGVHPITIRYKLLEHGEDFLNGTLYLKRLWLTLCTSIEWGNVVMNHKVGMLICSQTLEVIVWAAS